MSQQISDISMKHYPTPSLCQNKISFPLQQAKHESCISFVWLKNDHSAERHTRCAFSGANDRTQSSYRQRVINRSRSGTSVNENPCICFGTRLESIDSAETFSCERLVGNHSFIKNTFLFTHTPQQDLIACIRRETRLPCFGESSDLFSSSFFFNEGPQVRFNQFIPGSVFAKVEIPVPISFVRFLHSLCSRAQSYYTREQIYTIEFHKKKLTLFIHK